MTSSPSRVLRHSNLELVGGTAVDQAQPGQRIPRVLRQAAVAAFETQIAASGHSGQADQTGSYDEGFEAGRESARQQLLSASNALQAALETCRENLRDEFERQQAEMVQITIGLTEFVLGHAGHDGGAALISRLEEAIALLDEQDLVIAMCESDLPLAEQIQAPGIAIIADPDLKPGEAKVIGDWARADITRKKALEILAEDGVT